MKKNVNIVQKTSTNYTTIGMQLLEDDNCDIVNGLKKTHGSDTEEIIAAVYKKWISGTGRKPVTWSTLVDVLRDVELTSIADIIEPSLFQYSPPPSPPPPPPKPSPSKALSQPSADSEWWA